MEKENINGVKWQDYIHVHEALPPTSHLVSDKGKTWLPESRTGEIVVCGGLLRTRMHCLSTERVLHESVEARDNRASTTGTSFLVHAR